MDFTAEIFTTTMTSHHLIVGTYGQDLGFVDGQGDGIYTFAVSSAPDAFALTPVEAGRVAKHPSSVTNPTYLTHYKDAESGKVRDSPSSR
jgi:hypothetical protein